MPHETVLCRYDPVSGWRLAANTFSSFTSVRIIRLGGMKYLRLKASHIQKPGQYCLPRKLAGI